MSAPEEPRRTRLRVVLDSNVLISGLVFQRGNPAQIVEFLREGEIAACTSPFILEEISRSFREDFNWSESRVQEALTLLRSCCDVIEPVAEAAVSELTPADNRILDCAFQGGAQYLVTGDRGIQRVETFQGVSIVSPAEFLELLLRHRGELGRLE